MKTKSIRPRRKLCAFRLPVHTVAALKRAARINDCSQADIIAIAMIQLNPDASR
jgi:hypothetical protein